LLAGTAGAQPAVFMEAPWVREAPPGTAVNAAYMVIRNDGEEDTRIVSVSAEGFARVEIHETVEEDGRMRMRPIGELVVPAGKSVTLEPGGLHLMLREADERVTEGDWVTMHFTLASGALIEVTAQVRRRTGRSSDGDSA
jgi:copper(I)-binding protein